MTLTAKQEAFCQAIADGKNQSDAYRSAYNALNMKDSTITERASRLMAEGNISARVKELRSKLEEKQLWSRLDSVKALIEIHATADQAQSKIAAIKELNAMHGYNAPTKSEVMVRGGLVIVPGKA